MADVTIKYNGSSVAELNGTGNKTLKTSGKYCEGNVEVAYAPRSKTYEITLVKASGWVLLTTLDDDVIAHINDATLKVDFECLNPYVYTWYTGFRYHASNVPVGNYSGKTLYGSADRHQNETNTAMGHIYYPANHTVAENHGGAYGQFRLSGNQYYILPGDGFIGAGTYRLTFAW